MRKQNVIIFSSGKNFAVAEKIKQCFEKNKKYKDINPVVWKDLFAEGFTEDYQNKKSFPLFRFLIKRIPSFDFALIVAGDDDTTIKDVTAIDRKDVTKEHYITNEQDFVTTRDNVIFELGLCCMALGESRVILLRHEKVRLLDDLRGVNEDQHKFYDNKHILQNTLLTVNNIQIEGLEYKSNDDIVKLVPEIFEYINQSYTQFAPVVVGAACSTASGYISNFIQATSFALAKMTNPDDLSFGESGMTYWHNRNVADPFSLFKDPQKIEFHILLPSEEIIRKMPDELFNNPRKYINVHLLDNKTIIPKCEIKESSRNIGFSAKYIGIGGGKIIIFDFPTTILASYKTAVDILNINADEDKMQNTETRARYLIKEVDMFNSTLHKILKHDEEGLYLEITPDRDKPDDIVKYRVNIDTINFDENNDRAIIPWFYE